MSAILIEFLKCAHVIMTLSSYAPNWMNWMGHIKYIDKRRMKMVIKKKLESNYKWNRNSRSLKAASMEAKKMKKENPTQCI